MKTKLIDTPCKLSVDTPILLLKAANSLSDVQFRVDRRENRSAELVCRSIFVEGLTKDEADMLASDLNEAIRETIHKKISGLLNRAANQLRRYL